MTNRGTDANAVARETLERSPDAVVSLTPDYRIRYANPSAADLLHWDQAALLGRELFELFPAAEGLEIKALYDIAQATREPAISVRFYPAPLNVWFEIRMLPHAGGLDVSFRDISESHRRESRVREDEERWRLGLEAGQTATYEINLRTGDQEWSSNLASVIGHDPANGTPDFGSLLVRMAPEDQALAIENLQRARSSDLSSYRDEYRLSWFDGSVHWYVTHGRVHREDDSDRLIGTVTDITDRKRLEEQLAHAALSDSLTGLHNRAALEAHLCRLLAQGEQVTVLFCDLDGFKEINDTQGHATGDRILQVVAARLRTTLRAEDFVARFGGDEFVIVTTAQDTESEAAALAHRVQDCLRPPIQVDRQNYYVQITIGGATSQPGDDLEQILARADATMYAAKGSCRGSVQFYTAHLGQRMFQQVRLEQWVRATLDSDDFMMAYQPIVQLCDGRTVGYEALLRWRGNAPGNATPPDVIAAAQRIGLGSAMEQSIVMMACLDAVKIRRLSSDAFVTVNICIENLGRFESVEVFSDFLAHLGLPADAISLEITESSLVDQSLQVLNCLEALRATGINLLIDDFGVGFSSLSYLNSLPVTGLKIDRSFVQALRDDPRTTAIVTAILAMADALHLEVIAEGIESPDQAATLKALGCRFAQGYLFGRPVPVDTILSAALLPTGTG